MQHPTLTYRQNVLIKSTRKFTLWLVPTIASNHWCKSTPKVSINSPKWTPDKMTRSNWRKATTKQSTPQFIAEKLKLHFEVVIAQFELCLLLRATKIAPAGAKRTFCFTFGSL
jgi:hypothetical protein